MWTKGQCVEISVDVASFSFPPLSHTGIGLQHCSLNEAGVCMCVGLVWKPYYLVYGLSKHPIK